MASNIEPISPGLRRVADLAKSAPNMAFGTLAQHITPDLLQEAHRRTRKTGAPGVDDQTARDYEEDLSENIRRLHERMRSGRYRAPAVKRTYIPKADGKSMRPIGIPTFEDKIVQRGVTMVLETIYEQDFLDGSYGFRPGRSAHMALSDLRGGLQKMGGGWVLDVDIKNFFGALDHAKLKDILRLRMNDGTLLRFIGKWLKAGVLEAGNMTYPTQGTPQGGVISPMLANIYLHEALDKWFEFSVKPKLRGQAFLVRYADDFAIAFSEESDARLVMGVLPRRLGHFGLEIHPEKTKLLDFRKPTMGDPETFDLLGFTHYWARSRKGYWVVKQKTASKSLSRALKTLTVWCRTHRHLPVREQHRSLVRKLQGHCAYYGITGNARSLALYRHQLIRSWKKWLCRRSNKHQHGWAWYRQLLLRYPIPFARAVHSIYRRPASP